MKQEPENIDTGILENAFEYIQQLFNQWSAIEFIVLNETCEGVKAGELQGAFLHLGVLKRHTTNGLQLNFSVVKNLVEDYQDKDSRITFSLKINDELVPVVVEKLPNDYPCFMYPDMRYYKMNEFQVCLPNNPDSYLKWQQETL